MNNTYELKNSNMLRKSLVSFLMVILILLSLNACSSEKTANETAASNVCEYKSEKIGFTLSFPGNWKDQYSIVEKDKSVSVYFKPKEKLDNTGGLFFTIIEKTDDLDEEMFDSIYGTEKYIKINEVIYFIGGPLDVNFPENHPEFNDFLKLKNDIPEILKTISDNIKKG